MPITRAYLAVCDGCLQEAWAMPPEHATRAEYVALLKRDGWTIKRAATYCPDCRPEPTRTR
jgi:hypothetical protein